MIARLLRLILAVELLGAGLAAWLAVHIAGASLGRGGAALLGAGLVLAVHPLMILVYFAISRWAGTPPPTGAGLTPLAALKTFVLEYGASLRGFNLANPFFATRAAPRPCPPLQALPLLFVHGYFCNRAVWLPLMSAAARRGYRVEAITLEPPFGGIERYCDAIEAAFSQLLEAGGATRAVVVCHSMGGIAARAWLRRYGDARVERVITLGSPHTGTVLAALGRSGTVAQMRISSRWLADLAASESAARRARFTCLYSYHDDVVVPQLSGRLEGARNVELCGLGHVTLLYSRRVWKILFDELAALEIDPAAPQGAPRTRLSSALLP